MDQAIRVEGQVGVEREVGDPNDVAKAFEGGSTRSPDRARMGDGGKLV
jgi:hypothetical protein